VTITINVAKSVPRGVEAVGVPVTTEGAVPRSLGLSRAALAAHGFEGKPGQTLVIPSASGPTQIALGVGAVGAASVSTLRTAGASLARAAQRCATVATSLADLGSVGPKEAGQAVAEGIALASYRFTDVRSDKTVPAIERVTLVADGAKSKKIQAGAERGLAIAAATCLARDLANSPPNLMNAVDIAARAQEIADSASGLSCEVWGPAELARERCNGIVAVNAGSYQPPRLVRIEYTPKNPVGTIALVGKGVMFDSGGLSLKPSSGMETMKMDMGGAAAVLATMSVLPVIKPKVKVIGWLCCTDNMPSGSATKVSDVITYRNGKTVEVMNTDAEGRLVLADALVLAEEAKVDAIVDIATLTGACMVALGTKIAGLMGNHDGWIEQVKGASARTDERAWHLPLPDDYRKLIDSECADMKNVGGPNGGAITAGLFLKEFVGDRPWVHLDIAGKERVDSDEGWNVKGATGWGVRLFVDLLDHYAPV
jgi:leucyl aminopeptidase